MEKQTFINQMKARGFVPLANHLIHIDTPAVTAIVRKDATALRIVDGLTA